MCFSLLGGEKTLNATHALVEFEEEECTAVVPLHRIFGLKDYVEGEAMSVLWNNKKEYRATFIVSGKTNLVT